MHLHRRLRAPVWRLLLKYLISLPKSDDNQIGQSLVLVALLLVALAGMLGLALDGGRAFGARRQAQNAADAASLAAVRKLVAERSTTSEAAVWGVVTNLAGSNAVSSTNLVATFINSSSNDICTINQNCRGIPSNASGVRVTATVQLQPYFIDLLIGSGQIPVNAMAAAQGGQPAPNALMPMVVPCENYDADHRCNYTYDQMVTIKGDVQSSGSVQWLDYSVSGCGLADYLQLKPGCVSGAIGLDPTPEACYDPANPTSYNIDPPRCSLSPSPWVKTSTGQVAAVASSLDCWIDPSGRGCWQFHPAPTSRDWIIPIADHNNGKTGNNLWYHMFEFGDFEFYGYYFSNGSCNWVGKTAGQHCTGSDLPSALAQCAVDNVMCVEGKFKQLADVPINPGMCVLVGGNVCAIGMSE